MLELAGSTRPRVCFLPTAGGENAGVDRPLLRGVLRAATCEPSHLTLFGMPEQPGRAPGAQDVIYVGGGNTANMLAIWRVHGIDRALREAWSRGAVLGGWSAGANCWFEDCVTDSFGPELRDSATASASCRGASARTTTASRSGGRRTRGSSARASSRRATRPTTTRRSTSRGRSCARSSASETARAATASPPRARSRSSRGCCEPGLSLASATACSIRERDHEGRPLRVLGRIAPVLVPHLATARSR